MNAIQQQHLSDAGYERVSWHQPTDVDHRRLRTSWVMCLVLFVGLCVTVVVFLNNGFGPKDTTVQMERFVKQLDRLKAIRPEVAQMIERIVSQPQYDCDRVQCDAVLRERNHAVRARLTDLLADRTAVDEVSAIPAVQRLSRPAD